MGPAPLPQNPYLFQRPPLPAAQLLPDPQFLNLPCNRITPDPQPLCRLDPSAPGMPQGRRQQRRFKLSNQTIHQVAVFRRITLQALRI